MKKVILGITAAALLAVPATASAAPGQAIKTECETSYGQIIKSFQPGFVPGQHGKGGANAFSSPASLAIHCG